MNVSLLVSLYSILILTNIILYFFRKIVFHSNFNLFYIFCSNTNEIVNNLQCSSFSKTPKNYMRSNISPNSILLSISIILFTSFQTGKWQNTALNQLQVTIICKTTLPMKNVDLMDNRGFRDIFKVMDNIKSNNKELFPTFNVSK